MSLDQAKAFIEKMKSDDAFRERVMAIEDVAGRLVCIQSEGFACTEAEIQAVAGELRDEDLDSAAGGNPFFSGRTHWVGCWADSLNIC
ncbi:MAG: Nif11-like leader peptide family natural product precursor [Chlorobium sp.]|nr:MAG: Nif11-like leader peptide family natural product precursor [Chlorobium sp.]